MTTSKQRQLKMAISAIFVGVIFIFYSCSKIIEIDPPVNSITTELAFRDSLSANSSILGLYSKMQFTSAATDFYNGKQTELFGLYADELGSSMQLEFLAGNVPPDNSYLSGQLWSTPYNLIFHANSCIEGLNGSTGIRESAKNSFLAEAKFWRAFTFFYLVNIYGRIPYPESSSWSVNSKLPALDSTLIYSNIVKDLEFSFEMLPEDYSRFNSERVRVNRYCAAALLARVCLYLKRYQEADKWATMVIDKKSLYGLVDSVNDVFLRNSNESILQFQLSESVYPFDCTAEGVSFIPAGFANYFLTDELYNSFEETDRRKSNWIGSFDYNGTIYRYPFKYKLRDPTPNSTAPQYYTVLRIAELYLIRAEARCNMNSLSSANSDLAKVRERAGLAPYPDGTKDELMERILNERRHEFFCEWAHRWFDLKRVGLADHVLSNIKQDWKDYRTVLPFPVTELQRNPFLIQNKGY